MAVAYVIKERCPQDHSCPALPHCPTRAIVQEGYSAPNILEKKCIACGKCIKICPPKAFQLNE